MSAIQNDRAQRLPDDGPEPRGASPEARDEIEAVLSTFRQWLLECEHLHRSLTTAPSEEQEAVGAIDTSMHGLLSEWLALREELRREAGDKQSTAEQLQQSREQVQEALGGLEKSRTQMKESFGKLLAPLVVDRDRLRDDLRTRLQIQQHNWLQLILDIREGLAGASAAARDSLQKLKWRRTLVPPPVRSGVEDSFGTALSRIDNALDSRGVRKTAQVGDAVDPQTMKVVETVEHEELPPGHVVEVLAHGYRVGGEVVRFAEVRATPSAG